MRQGRVGAVLGLLAGPGATLLMTVWEDQTVRISVTNGSSWVHHNSAT